MVSFSPWCTILIKSFFTILLILLSMCWTEFKIRIEIMWNQKKPLRLQTEPFSPSLTCVFFFFLLMQDRFSSSHSLFRLKIDSWKRCSGGYPSRMPMDDHGLVSDLFLSQLSLYLCQLQSLVLPLRGNQRTWMISWLL